MVSSQVLQILVADDEDIVHQTIGGHLRQLGHHIDEARDGLAASLAIKTRDYDLALVDVRMPGRDGLSVLSEAAEERPDLPLVIMSGQANVEMTVQTLRRGATDFLTKPIDLLELEGVVEKSQKLRGLADQRHRLRRTLRNLGGSDRQREADLTVVGTSLATRRLRQQIRQAAEADCRTILITGATGTGKEVVARAIHHQAGPESPLIAVSCMLFPDTLVESELFGHVKGAFTGATRDRLGCFELADGGMLFLDEVGELSPGAQAKMLRVLESRSLRRVGAPGEIEFDVRVIAATNVPLDQLVAAGKFRRDLFYRLNVFPIELLPLRDRREDILPLAEHFLACNQERRGGRHGELSPAARDALVCPDYPGNARELRNVIERAVVLAGAGQIRPEHLRLQQLNVSRTAPKPAASDGDDEGNRISKALEEAKWNRRAAAEALDMPYYTLRYKMQRMGIGR